MTTIIHAIVNNDAVTRAVRPLYAGHIASLEKDFARAIATIMSKPEIQVDLYCCHPCSRVAIIGSVRVSQAMNL